MRRWKTVLSATAVAALMFIGCGGGGGGGTTEEGKVSVNLKGADWAAYAASPWKKIDIESLGTDKIFKFDPGSDGKYGVAIHCADGGKEISIYQGTIGEISYIDGGCENPKMYQVSGTIKGITGTDVEIALKGNSISKSVISSNDKNYTINSAAGISDLLVADIRSFPGYSSISQFGIKRDINIDSNKTGIDLDLELEGINSMEHNFTVSPDGGGRVAFISKNGSLILTGSSTDGTGKWYSLKSGVESGDLYSFIAYNENNTKLIFEAKSATKEASDITYEPEKIADFNASMNMQRVFENLGYTPAADSHSLVLYYLTTGQTPDEEWQYQIFVTPQWLDGNSSYVVPGDSLSQVEGWSDEWALSNDDFSWSATAVMANKKISDILGNAMEGGEGIFFAIDGLSMHWSVAKMQL